MTDNTPKTDAERLAALEDEVSELRDICANLFNSIHYSMDVQQLSQRFALQWFATRVEPPGMKEPMEDAAEKLDASLGKARRLIWGEAQDVEE